MTPPNQITQLQTCYCRIDWYIYWYIAGCIGTFIGTLSFIGTCIGTFIGTLPDVLVHLLVIYWYIVQRIFVGALPSPVCPTPLGSLRKKHPGTSHVPHVCMHACMYVYIYIYICMYVCR